MVNEVSLKGKSDCAALVQSWLDHFGAHFLEAA